VRVSELLKSATLETLTRHDAGHDLAALAPGSEVFVSCLPRDTWQAVIDTTRDLAAAGFRPVPHVPVRRLAHFEEAASLIAALSEAGARALLVIAGDIGVTRGDYPSSLHLLQSGLLTRDRIDMVYFAGHPEGSSFLTEERGLEVLASKITAADRFGVASGVVTQFCLGAEPIERWLLRYQAQGLSAPVKIGLAGPAGAAHLLRMALRCGIGESIATLQRRVGTAALLLRDAVPDDVILGLGPVLAQEAGKVVTGFHLYPFGGIPKALAWRERLLARLRADIDVQRAQA
jgi:methylenetetrahydrofolate reductase (NADPH)